MNACTIIAKNYVAFARVLAASFFEHHPDGRFWVLVIDDYEGWIDPAQERFELVTSDDLDVPGFHRMAAAYNVLELSTAVKPWLLRHLMEKEGAERLVYLDPDIRIYRSLDEVDRLLDENEVVVTPHLTEPMPRDGKTPSETDILSAGSYNLGFLGVRLAPPTAELLDWWEQRLARDCIIAPERGYFVDQRWMDFAPGLVRHFHVLTDPGFNVAYWNLAGRRVSRNGDGYEVNGHPLRFFHFSGFDPREPERLSRHQNRVQLPVEPVLRELASAYAEEVLEAGFAEAAEWPYTHDRLPNGLPLDKSVRVLYRRAEAEGAVSGSAFEPAGAARFINWLNEPAEIGGEAGVTRYLYGLRDSRPDLQVAFPNLAGQDAERYVTWATLHGRVDSAIPAELLPSSNGNGAVRARLGVNVAGYFESVLGVGQAARQVVQALETQDVAVSTVGMVANHSEQSEQFEPRGTRSPVHPINLVCVNADVLGQFAFDIGEEFFADRYSIGMWWWEVDRFPEAWHDSFRHVDEIWVGSRHIADALEPVAPVPIVRVPIPVCKPKPAALGRRELGLPGGFLFLFSFDYESVFNRKNPLAVVEAFKLAFPECSGPALVIKSINHEHHPDEHRRLCAAARRRDIVVLDRYLARPEMDALTTAADCYVSLHRSEGFGFTLAEPMALGKPVIATGYSGNLEYMTADNSYLVDYELVPIGPGSEPYPADGVWAEPNLGHAAELMRRVLEDPAEAAEVGERARKHIETNHSLEAAGRVMAERLQTVRDSALLEPRRAPSALVFDSKLVAERVRRGPSDDWIRPGRFARLRRALRRVVLRLMLPYRVHEQSIDSELVRGLQTIDHSVQNVAADLRAATAAANARIDDLAGQTDALRLATNALRAGSEAVKVEFDAEVKAEHAASDARVDDLVAQINALRQQVEEASRFIASFGMTGGSIGARTASVGEYPEAPQEPWTPEYVDAHRDFVACALDDPQLGLLFRKGDPLPNRYGIAFDERVVEFPWLFSRDLHGKLLDAGSTLNHAHTLTRIRPRVSDLHIVTSAPEPQAYPYLDVSYLFADLRELPMRDATYDRVTCLSTLEHVGMDNSQYGGGSRAADPEHEAARALGELRRVLVPGGTLFLTVPFGRPEDFGWQRVFDENGLRKLIELFEPAEQTITIYAYGPDGWRLSSAEEARDLRYRDHFTADGPDPDRAVAARAVACLELVRSSG